MSYELFDIIMISISMFFVGYFSRWAEDIMKIRSSRKKTEKEIKEIQKVEEGEEDE